jgi:diguanylate cyclase (GGDEF)-like protein
MENSDALTAADTNSTAITRRRTGTTSQLKLTPALVCFEGPERGKSFSITQTETVIGRSPDASIHLTDEMASRLHAKLQYANATRPKDQPECYIEDLKSSNGTEVNGQPIHGRVRLRPLDRIQIGSTLLGFVVKDENEVRMQETFFEFATRDSLTGLNNRRQFMSQIGQHLQLANRRNRPVSLIIIDADRFKGINDKYGHETGDCALMHIGRIITECCRAEELAARWGGEEFIILLPDCDAVAAKTAAERIRAHLEANPLMCDGQSLQMTVSVGGATMEKSPEFTTLFRKADEQLLEAKRAGRNRVHITNCREQIQPNGSD